MVELTVKILPVFVKVAVENFIWLTCEILVATNCVLCTEWNS
jgi:hypothetical protein